MSHAGRNAARPRGTDARILLALTRAMLEAVNAAAARAGLSRAEWLRRAIAKQLAQSGRESCIVFQSREQRQ